MAKTKGKEKHDYVITQDFKSPYVVSTGMAHKPTEIKAICFKKGQVIQGEMKTANGKPSFVLYKGVVVVPVTMVRKVETKQIVVSNASGDDHKAADTQKQVAIIKNKKTKWIDAVIIGALAGFGGTYLAEKKGWLKTVETKNRLIGMGIGAVLAVYVTYRMKSRETVKTNA